MEHFGDRLLKASKAKKSVTVVGIDPAFEKFPPALQEMVDDPVNRQEALEIFGKGIVDAVKDFVPAVKPNIAFYEAHGVPGIMAYITICAYAHSAGLLVLGDIKRGDIGSTAAAYADGMMRPAAKSGRLANPFQIGPHDAVTLNPYLGYDNIGPFFDMASENGQGLYILVKTSNPTSSELQDLELKSGGTVAQAVARLVNTWAERLLGASGLSSVGAVVGATHPEELGGYRELMPNVPFLIPGYGAQGGTAAGIMGGFRADGSGALVNASRSVIYAWMKDNKPDDWQGAAERAVIAMNADINTALKEAGKNSILC